MKKKKETNSFLARFVSILSLAAIVAVVSVYLYQSFQIDIMMKDLHALHQQKERLISETESLQAEVDRLSNIDRISRIAHEEYGLEFSDGSLAVINLGDRDDLEDLKKQFAHDEVFKQEINTAGIQ